MYEFAEDREVTVTNREITDAYVDLSYEITSYMKKHGGAFAASELVPAVAREQNASRTDVEVALSILLSEGAVALDREMRLTLQTARQAA